MITVVVKSPSRPTGQLRLESVPLEITVGQLKEILSKQYPGNPHPSDQTLIYAGKVLKDASVTLKQLIGSIEHSDGSPYHFHLVVKPTTTESTASTSQSQPQASTSQAANTQRTNGNTSQPGSSVTPTQTNNPQSQSAEAGVANALQQVLEALGAGSTDRQAGEGLPFPTLPTLPTVQLPSITYTLHPVVASAYHAAYSAALAAGHQAHKQLLIHNSVQPVSANVQPAAQASASSAAEQPQGDARPTNDQTSDASGSRQNSPVPPDQLQQLLAKLQESANAINTAASQADALSNEAQRQQQLEQLRQLSAQVQDQVNAVQAQAAMQIAQSTLTTFVQYERALAQEQQRQHAIAAQRQAAEIADLIDAQAQNFGLTGVRRRAGGGGAAAAAGAGPLAPAAPRRQRTFILRINMRGLLQLLVFAMVLYQHFTWKRFAMLATLGFALWLTSLAPLRRFIASLQAPHLPRPAAAPLVPAAQPVPNNEQQPQGQQPANADADANMQRNARAAAGGLGGAAAGQPDRHVNVDRQGHVQPQQPVRRGVLGEIAVVLVGFVTSLLPSWNYNPDDAAAFAVAQDVEAREQQQARRNVQQAAGAGEGQQVAQAPVAPANANNDVNANHPHQD